MLKNARRLWYWAGACSLSQLAMEGTKKAEECKFPCEVETVELNQVIEIIDCTEEARLSIKNVTIWERANYILTAINKLNDNYVYR